MKDYFSLTRLKWVSISAAMGGTKDLGTWSDLPHITEDSKNPKRVNYKI